jgi:SM-20-related protein
MMFDLLLLEDFLDPATLDAVFTDAHAAAGAAATVHGYGRADEDVAPRVRRTTQLTVSDATRQLVGQRLSEVKPALAERFGIALSDHEALQFLRYEIGGFFVAHQDGNTPMTRDHSRNRRISIVIFLNTGYTGGELVFHAPYPDVDTRKPIIGPAGSLLAFRSETTHEVMMVTGGERYTIATWFHAAR